MGGLTVKNKTGLIGVINHSGLDNVIKPLVQDIFLYETTVAGTSHLEDKSVLEEIREGDRLILRREDNPFDENAIMLLAPSGKKLGYVPRRDNIIFTRLMDAGKCITAKIDYIEDREVYSYIEISLYLMDF